MATLALDFLMSAAQRSMPSAMSRSFAASAPLLSSAATAAAASRRCLRTVATLRYEQDRACSSARTHAGCVALRTAKAAAPPAGGPPWAPSPGAARTSPSEEPPLAVLRRTRSSRCGGGGAAAASASSSRATIALSFSCTSALKEDSTARSASLTTTPTDAIDLRMPRTEPTGTGPWKMRSAGSSSTQWSRRGTLVFAPLSAEFAAWSCSMAF